MTTPFQGQFVVSGLRLAMNDLLIKFEVFMFTHYEDMKGKAKCRNWVGLGVRVTQDHRQCDHSIEHV